MKTHLIIFLTPGNKKNLYLEHFYGNEFDLCHAVRHAQEFELHEANSVAAIINSARPANEQCTVVPIKHLPITQSFILLKK